MVSSCKTIVQYHDQDIDSNTIHRIYLHFASFTRTHLCISEYI